MSAQDSEGLLYEGERYAMQATPLEDYFKQVGKKPMFSLFSTNNWRGYVGQWEIADGKLYLVQLMGMGLKNMDTGVLPGLVPNRIGVADIFPKSDGRVLADWYTGQLRCPQGEVVEYYRGEFGALYERYLVIDIKAGIVTGEEILPGIRNINPRAFANVKCKACGFTDRLMLPSDQWYEPKQKNLPVWCKDCGALTLSDYNKKPLRCGKCASKRVMGPDRADRGGSTARRWLLLLRRITWPRGESMKLDRGKPNFGQSEYLCPQCGSHTLAFNRSVLNQIST